MKKLAALLTFSVLVTLIIFACNKQDAAPQRQVQNTQKGTTDPTIYTGCISKECDKVHCSTGYRIICRLHLTVRNYPHPDSYDRDIWVWFQDPCTSTTGPVKLSYDAATQSYFLDVSSISNDPCENVAVANPMYAVLTDLFMHGEEDVDCNYRYRLWMAYWTPTGTPTNAWGCNPGFAFYVGCCNDGNDADVNLPVYQP